MPMKMYCCLIRRCLYGLCLALSTANARAQIVINEVFPNGTSDAIEIKNSGGTAIDISGWWICHLFNYQQVNQFTASGNLNLAPGAIVTLTGFNSDLSDTASDLGLFVDTSFGSVASIRSFMQYGSSPNGRESIAVTAGLWPLDSLCQFREAGSL